PRSGGRSLWKSVAPTALMREQTENLGLAPEATSWRRSAAQIGCASRGMLDSRSPVYRFSRDRIELVKFPRECRAGFVVPLHRVVKGPLSVEELDERSIAACV